MAEEWIIYHNPRCSKSRQTLERLEDNNIKPKVVEYLKNPLNLADLKVLAQKLGASAKLLLRKKDAAEAGVKASPDDLEACLKAIAKHPELMERPIVVKGKKAVIARPPELVDDLL